MAKRPGAGDLDHKVAFDARVAGNPDSPADYGNTQMDFVEQFQCRAAFKYGGGSEAIVAARLEGRGVLKVRIRSNPQTRAIQADWQMRDVNRVLTYAIKDVDSLTDRDWVWLIVQQGVAA